ncbi:fatty acyl-AMP ligase [Micromonospora sp. NPDC005215]|uniref:fatty acyl-AMP ligase n=1 Tax=Micromonospora sp. NPDC005215 TaxID=3157024 RepID=UPI0033A3E6C5
MRNVKDAANMTSVLAELARTTPDRDSVVYVDDPGNDVDVRHPRLSYAELDAAARQLAARIQEHLAPGDRALLLYPSGLAFPVAFFACLYAGVIAVPAPVPGRYRHERLRLAGVARNAGARVVLTDAESREQVEQWLDAEDLTELTVLETGAAADPQPDLDDAWPVATHRTPAMLQYTSGSTADPKGVRISHGNLLCNVDTIARTFPVHEGRRYAGWIPLFHDMGLVGLMLTGILTGRSVVLLPPAGFLRRPQLWLRTISRYDVGATAAPDFAYDLCVRRIKDDQLDGVDLSCWQYAINGSEPVRAATLRAFNSRFAGVGLSPHTIVPCFGMAEATLLVSGTPHRPVRTVHADAAALERHEFAPAGGDAVRELVSCGAPLDIDVRIVDPTTHTVLPEGRIGELWLSGDTVAQGYWNNETATARAFGAALDGTTRRYLRTGDLGFLLDGELYVTGRIKDVLVIKGRNLYPQDLEQTLRAEHSELSGSVGAAFLVPATNGADAEDELVVAHEVRGRLDGERLSSLAVHIRQTVAREFGLSVAHVALLRPGGVSRTTSGKIQRSAVRQHFLDGELSPIFANRVGAGWPA